MSAAAETVNAAHSDSLWLNAMRKFRRDRVGVAAFLVVMLYALIAIGVVFGWWGSHWADVSGPKWAPMSAEYWFGTSASVAVCK